MRLLLSIVITLMLIAIELSYCRTASAGPCQESLSPDPIAERDGYRERGGGQRCEGIYTSPVAGEALEIVGVTRGRLDYDLEHTAPSSITLAVTSSKATPVHVRAVGIPEHLYYEMDADMPADGVLVWPIKEVVAPERIAPIDIGVYAFGAGSGGDPVFIPVSISSGAAPTPILQPLIVILRVGDLASLTWRFVPRGGAAGQFNPATIDDNRITLTLPATVHLPGLLELRWDEASTGKSHITVFALGD